MVGEKIAVDMTIPLWGLIVFAGTVAIFLISQYVILTSIKKWAGDHQVASDKAVAILNGLVVTQATITSRLDEHERRLDKGGL